MPLPEGFRFWANFERLYAPILRKLDPALARVQSGAFDQEGNLIKHHVALYVMSGLGVLITKKGSHIEKIELGIYDYEGTLKPGLVCGERCKRLASMENSFGLVDTCPQWRTTAMMMQGGEECPIGHCGINIAMSKAKPEPEPKPKVVEEEGCDCCTESRRAERELAHLDPEANS